jgi:hypothetical protein
MPPEDSILIGCCLRKPQIASAPELGEHSAPAVLLAVDLR